MILNFLQRLKQAVFQTLDRAVRETGSAGQTLRRPVEIVWEQKVARRPADPATPDVTFETTLDSVSFEINHLNRLYE